MDGLGTIPEIQVAVVMGFQPPAPAASRRRMGLSTPRAQVTDGLWHGPEPVMSAWSAACGEAPGLPFLAYLMAEQSGWLRPGDRILVHADAGGVRLLHPRGGGLAHPRLARRGDRTFNLLPGPGDVGRQAPDTDPVSAGYAPYDIQRVLADVLRADFDHCRKLLDSLPGPATAWLLGAPTSRSGTRTGASKRLARGPLFTRAGEVSDLGIVRLHAEAGLLVRPADRRRQLRLSAFRQRARRHWLAVHREVSWMLRAGAVPLGIEFSATAAAIEACWQRIPDALCVGPEGELIWVEVARRPSARATKDDRHRYELEVPGICAKLAETLGRPVRFHLCVGGNCRSTVFDP